MIEFLINWGWPQWTIAVLFFLALLKMFRCHGEYPKPVKYSFFMALAVNSVFIIVLYFGGFWT